MAARPQWLGLLVTWLLLAEVSAMRDDTLDDPTALNQDVEDPLMRASPVTSVAAPPEVASSGTEDKVPDAPSESAATTTSNLLVDRPDATPQVASNDSAMPALVGEVKQLEEELEEARAKAAQASNDAMPVTMMGFVAFNFSVIYVTNSASPWKRYYFYRMICATVVIFAALLIEMSLTTFWMKGVVGGLWLDRKTNKEGSSGTYKIAYASLLAALSIAGIFLLSYRCWKVQSKSQRYAADMLATTSLLVHTAGFCALDLFGKVETHLSEYLTGLMRGSGATSDQSYGTELLTYLFCPLLAIGFFQLLSRGTADFRSWLLGTEEPLPEEVSINARRSMALARQESAVSRAYPVKMDGSSIVKNKEEQVAIWEEEVMHAENDCAAMTTGFVVRQFLIFLFDDKQRAGTKSFNSGMIESDSMGAVMYLCVGVLLIVQGVFGTMDLSTSKRVSFLQDLSCWTTAWCTMSLVAWAAQAQFSRQDHQMLFLFAIASTVCVTSIWILDRLERWRMLSSRQMVNMIKIMGAVTGLCWQRTFTWAVKEVVKAELFFDWSQKFTERKTTPEIMKMTEELRLFEVVTYILVLAVIIPAWWLYIVPLASIDSSPQMLALKGKVGEQLLKLRTKSRENLAKKASESTLGGDPKEAKSE